MLESQSFDDIITETMQEYADLHIYNEFQTVRILIQPPIENMYTVVPPLALEILLTNTCGKVYAMLLEWHICDISDKLIDMFSDLLSLEEYLSEQDSNDDDEDEDDVDI